MDKYKFNIAFVVGGLPFHGDTYKENSLGGSESAALFMARSLKKLGHNVLMFSNVPLSKEGEYEGVKYLNIDKAVPFLRTIPVDFLIVQREPSFFKYQLKSKYNIIWLHDLALKRYSDAFVSAMWDIDKVFCVSNWHTEQVQEVYNLPSSIFYTTSNGIDLKKIQEVEETNRNFKNLVYAARPERGLLNLVWDIAPALFAKDNSYKIYITTYHNPISGMQGLLDKITEGIKKYPNNFEVLPSLKKEDLYKLYKSCGAYIYPTEFEEVSCISAMEAMACGLPFITSRLAALPETLDCKASILLNGKCSSKSYIDKFVENVIKITTDREKWGKMSQAGLDKSQYLDWDLVASDWDTYFSTLIDENGKSTKYLEKVSKYFLWRSDIIAAKKVSTNMSESYSKKYIDEYINKNYRYLETREKYKEYYDTMSQGAHFSTGRFAYKEPRLGALIQWFNMHPNIKKVLDYGCAHGGYSIALSNQFPEIEFVGVDISDSLIEAAKKLREADSKYPNNVRFMQLEQFEVFEESFDAIICCEVMEHVPQPHILVSNLEKYIKEDGYFIGTVPFGFSDKNNGSKYPAHVWEFEPHDLDDLFARKTGFIWNALTDINVDPLDESVRGWYFFSFKRDNNPIGEINLQRKIVLQNPKESISLCMLTKNSENMLHRTLKSVIPYVDEVIAVDTGSTDSTKKILEQYGTRIFDGENPLEVGFDTVRNFSIKQATSDWILWLDSDEELQTPFKIRKYLRPNIFDGYNIRQHHFSCQPPNAFEPDMPTRIFRNDGKTKFYGFVHEHPEKKINDGVGRVILLGDVDIAHDGYLTEHVRKQRFFRNINLMFQDQKKYPERILGKILMMRDWILLARYELEQTGGQVTPNVINYCENVVKMYQNNFRKTLLPIRNGVSPIAYYSDALRILGRGLEYSWDFKLGQAQDKMLSIPSIQGRFQSEEEFLEIAEQGVKVLTDRFKGKYV